MKRDINKQIFYASPIVHNGYPALMIRKIISDRAVISQLARQILEQGTYNINGVLIFRNPIIAVNHLRELGLVDINLAEIFAPDFSKKH